MTAPRKKNETGSGNLSNNYLITKAKDPIPMPAPIQNFIRYIKFPLISFKKLLMEPISLS